MSQMIFCKKYQKDLEALTIPPFPGKKGQEIVETVSKQAWQEWLKYQTMLINEKHLNMMSPEAREFLSTEMDKFFDNSEDLEPVAGYVPPES